MTRRFNYTGRKKIAQADVRLAIHKVGSTLSFSADFSLADYAFPPHARVYVEAYRGLSALWKRFEFGRVGLLCHPDDRSLNEFENPEGILFRVKISGDEGSIGKLLGEADGIRPRLPNEVDGQSLHLIEAVPGVLQGEPWRVDFSGSQMPQLVIDEQIEDWNILARTPTFRALVAPAVMRQVLTRMLVVDGFLGEEDDEDDWRTRWVRFAESVSGSECPRPLARDEDLDGRPDIVDWIDGSVAGFANRTEMVATIVAELAKEKAS